MKIEYELKPCPFCGEDVAELTTLKELEDCSNFESKKCPAFRYDECHGARVVCNVNRGGCGASTGFAWSEEAVVEKWNRRA